MLEEEKAAKLSLESSIRSLSVRLFIFYFLVLRVVNKVKIFKMNLDSVSREKKTLDCLLQDYKKKFNELSELDSKANRSFEIARVHLQSSFDQVNNEKAYLTHQYHLLESSYNKLNEENAHIKV